MPIEGEFSITNEFKKSVQSEEQQRTCLNIPFFVSDGRSTKVSFLRGMMSSSVSVAESMACEAEPVGSNCCSLECAFISSKPRT